MYRRLIPLSVAALVITLSLGFFFLIKEDDTNEGGFSGRNDEPGVVHVFYPYGSENVSVNIDPGGEIVIGEMLGNFEGPRCEEYTLYLEDGNITPVTSTTALSTRDGSLYRAGERIGAVAAFPGNFVHTMDVAPLVLDSLEVESSTPRFTCAIDPAFHTEHVIMVIIDGLGFYDFIERYQGLAANVTSIGNITGALTAAPSITNVAVTTILTGVPPSVHGITERARHRLRSPDIISLTRDGGLTSALIEGSIGFIDVSMINTVDDDGDGYVDDEIRDAALDRIENNLTVVHFHGVDDAGHTYGPDSDQFLRRVMEVDGYVGELMEATAARYDDFAFIVVSDHGMHGTTDPVSGERSGEHGTFHYRDMVSLLAWGHFNNGKHR